MDIVQQFFGSGLGADEILIGLASFMLIQIAKLFGVKPRRILSILIVGIVMTYSLSIELVGEDAVSRIVEMATLIYNKLLLIIGTAMTTYELVWKKASKLIIDNTDNGEPRR